MTNKMPVNQGRRADRIGFEDTWGLSFPGARSDVKIFLAPHLFHHFFWGAKNI